MDFVPPSMNACHRVSKKRIYNSKRYVEFLDKVKAIECKQQIKGTVYIDVSFYFSDKRKRDLDNYITGLLNALKKRWFEDDDQVYKLVLTKHIGCKFDKTVVTIKEFKTPDLVWD